MEDKKIKFKKFWPGIAWFLFTGVLVFLPGNDIPKTSLLDLMYFDKFVHASIFGGLTLSFCLPFFKSHFSFQEKIHHFIRISLAAIVWGITVEVIQHYFIPGRTFDLLDWAADSFGVIVGFWVAFKIARHFERRTLNITD
jgi:hypothetical protein